MSLSLFISQHRCRRLRLDLEQYSSMFGMDDLPFEDQLNAFLSTPIIDMLYSKDIARDSDGRVLHTRIPFEMTQVRSLHMSHTRFSYGHLALTFFGLQSDPSRRH